MRASVLSAPVDVPRRAHTLAAVALLLSMTACISAPGPHQVRIPAPVLGNTGQFMSPYTTDGTIAPWVRKARAASVGAAVGRYAGRELGEAALGSVPLFGSMIGKRAGESAGRAAALALVGGEAALREGSDLSFTRVEDLAVFLHAYTPADTAEQRLKPQVISLTSQIYPSLLEVWDGAIKRARLPNGQSQVLPPGMPANASTPGAK